MVGTTAQRFNQPPICPRIGGRLGWVIGIAETKLTPVAKPLDAEHSEVLRVSEIEACDERAWSTFVADHPDGLIYHRPEWLQVLRHEYGGRVACLACKNAAGEIQGVLPLAWTKGLPFVGGSRAGRRISSLPRTPVAGPLALHDRARAALVDAAVELVDETPGASLELKLSWAGSAPAGLVAVPWRSAYVLSLPSRPGELRFGSSRNHARIKWSIGKAARSGVVVRDADSSAELRAWYQLYLETMRIHVLPPRPLRLFEAMWEVLRPRGLMRLLLAVHKERILAGSICLMSGRSVAYAFNGCTRTDLALRPNDVIQWHAIVDACRAGYRSYDLGEVSNGNEGLADFKAKWGAGRIELLRCYHPRPAEPQLDAGPSDAKTLWRAWRRLPLGWTAAIGDAIYRFM